MVINLTVIKKVLYGDNISLLFNDKNRIIIFSDCHMGDRSKADDFNEIAFKWFLDNIVTEKDLLIGNGDIFDIWRSGYHMFQCYSDLIDELFKENKCLYISGNHDCQMNRFAPVFSTNRFVGCGIVAEHGHEADLLNSKMGFIGEVSTWIYSGFERIFGNKEIDKIEKYEKKVKSLISPSSLNNNDLKKANDNYISYMSSVIDQYKDVVIGIYGHTHLIGDFVGGVVSYNGKPCRKIILNSGNFVRDNTFVILEKDQYLFCKIEE